MNQHLQNILDILKGDGPWDPEKRAFLLKSLKDADRELQVTSFKLDSAEKVKRTTGVLLEETIAELEQKRMAVEAQKRELEIEAALERVRSRAMAMFESSEIKAVAREMRVQLGLLGEKDLETCAVHLWDPATGAFEGWAALRKPGDSGELIESELKLNIKDVRILEESFAHYQAGDKDYVLVNDYEKAIGFFEAIRPVDAGAYAFLMRTIEHLRPEDICAYWSISDFEGGSLVMVTMTPPADASRALLRRFAGVFGLAYKRYKDIQQAEAQAREAQIEASLERVRSRSMAMRTSDELKDVIQVVYDQMVLLKMPIEHTGFILDYKNRDDYFSWIADHLGSPSHVVIPYFKAIYYDRFNEAKGTGADFFALQLSKEQKDGFYRDLFVHLPGFPEASKAFLFEQPALTISTVLLDDVALYVENFTETPFSDAENAVLMRFGSVFQQAYKRFLDLQKAEAQTREAQIEASLERVRSKTMAMHDSQDVGETVVAMFDEFARLGLESHRSGIFIFDQDETLVVWAAWRKREGKAGLIAGTLPIKEHDIFQSALRAWKKGDPFHQYLLEGDGLVEYYKVLDRTETYSVKFDLGNLPAKEYHSDFYFKHGALFAFTGDPIPEAHARIYARFAKVFDQTYTRYLDLQKAEAQAREAQIQLALERVRARTMAMQKSSELGEVAALLFMQVKGLGIESYSSGFTVWENDNKELVSWMCNADGSINPPFRMPADDIEWHREQYASWKRREEHVIHDFSGADMEEHYRYLRSFPLLDEAFRTSERAGVKTPERQVHNVFNFSQGNLLFITLEPAPESFDIFRRFAETFEQTYTRFLDLLKAEAQAREARIEAALERIRSRTMAMSKSNEIAEIGGRIFSELRQLDLVLNRVLIWIFNDDEKYLSWWSANPEIEGEVESYRVDYNDQPVFLSYLKAWQRREPLFQYTLAGDLKRQWEDHLFQETELSKLPSAVREGMRSEGGIFTTSSISDYGLMMVGSYEPLSDENTDIIQRFGRVFQQSYTRYLDVQKAELQAREAQIEVGLERVRSRAMAMQSSDELKILIGTVFDELTKLDLALTRCIIWVFEKDTNATRWWMANGEDPADPANFYVKYHDHPAYLTFVQAWKEQRERFVYDLKGEDKVKWDDLLFGETELSGLPEVVKQGMRAPERVLLSASFNNFGGINVASLDPLSDEHFDILLRFAKVFDLTYTRFLDLQNAEAQAKESRIQLALERVRARTMAMQRSDELSEISFELFKQIQSLGIATWHCAFNIYDDGQESSTEWGSNAQGVYPMYKTPRVGVFKKYFDIGQTGVQLHVEVIGEDIIADHYAYLCSLPGVGEELLRLKRLGMEFPTFQIDHVAYFKYGYLIFITYEQLPESHDVFKRFARAFEQTYTRFLDLKKAEAQAREAQIEAALERVRSSSLAMHKSDDLQGVVNAVIEKLRDLGVQFDTGNILILNNDRQGMDAWTGTNSTQVFLSKGWTVPFDIDPRMEKWRDAFDHGADFIQEHFDLEEKNRLFGNLFMKTEFKELPEDRKAFILDGRFATFLVGLRKEIGIQVISYSRETFAAEEIELIKRFAKVFHQAFVRFLDLKKAEAQAREAQIEAALERIRARTMAMQKSDELSEVVFLLFKQFEDLGEHPDQATIGIVNEEEYVIDYWVTMYGSQFDRVFKFSIEEPHVTGPVYKGWKAGERSMVIDLRGKELLEFSEYRERMGGARRNPEEERRLINVAFFSQGLLNVQSKVERSRESLRLLERFASVFEQTYTRFLDLKKAEQLALETLKRASVDRIRAEIASMRTVSDLEGINPLLWRELNAVGVPFIRCGVFIMDEEHQQIQTMLSTSDGRAIASFHLPYEQSDPLPDLVPHWRNKSVYKLHWDEAAFIASSRILMQRGAIDSAARYETDHRPTDLHLHFLPFQQGMLYVGNVAPLSDDQLHMVQNLAEAFAIAYARYEDFTRLEAAKAEIERTLTDLKKAQVQLVQAEKMASLGELTAGIAHEIQNPLNFVNNFADINKELLEDLKSQHEKVKTEEYDQDEVDDLLKDLEQNTEKIAFHGRRADGIVKSMLQHSRTSSGQKEPTDLAALADEYLKLSYHGMRAKEKSFNVTMETDFDPDLPKANVVAQDIGRVLLNLYNNAFQAVMERKKSGEAGYEPKVRVEVRRVVTAEAQRRGDNPESRILHSEFVTLRVTDNGPGIPEAIRDKIFQPFFTTKPTGQGTGLGLSLSYDIVVKGHGGTLVLAGSGSEGASFQINLPI